MLTELRLVTDRSAMIYETNVPTDQMMRMTVISSQLDTVRHKTNSGMLMWF